MQINVKRFKGDMQKGGNTMIDIKARLKSYVRDRELQTADFWTDSDNVYGLNFDGYHVEICCAVGGPRVKLDTKQGKIIGTWGFDEVTRSVPAAVVQEVREYYANMCEIPID